MESTFHGVIAFAFLSSMLVIGSFIRSKLSFLKYNLIPSSLIGGVIGFSILNWTSWTPFSSEDFLAITFHFFTLSFMSLCLCGGLRRKKPKNESSAGILQGGMWLTATWTFTLGLQAIIGIACIYLYNLFSGGELSVFLGSIVAHGFTQGPGQALTYGSIWESQYGIVNVMQVGVIYASLGFMAAFFIGVPMARRYLGLGLNSNQNSKMDTDYLNGMYKAENSPSSGKLVTHSANLDSLAYHIGLLGVAYVVTYMWLSFIQPYTQDLVLWGVNFGVLFSFNMFFIHGLVVCLILRSTMNKLGYCKTVDDETLKRVTGSSVDFMVTGTVMSIKFSVLSLLLVPILLVAVCTAIVTYFSCVLVGRFSGELGPERAVTAFGCCCGSTGTGLLLLRMLDVNFNTPIAKELAFFNIAIIITTFPLLMIFTPIAPSLSLSTYLTVLSVQSLFALGIMLFLMLKPTPITNPRGANTHA
ncbi:MAG: sodium/glutamate symporter [Vibrio sp.]